MNFITINQYFNKLQSALLFRLIVPLLVFIALYFYESGKAPDPDPQTEVIIILTAIVLLDWLMAMIFFNKKIKSVRNEQGLGLKLEKYFRLTIARFSILSSGSLIMALGLYLTKSEVFIWMYMAGLVLSGILWPTGPKISNDLRLRGDEKEMVYFKKDM